MTKYFSQTIKEIKQIYLSNFEIKNYIFTAVNQFLKL